VLLLLVLASCESNSFDADKRQLIAKDEIRSQLHKAKGFDITSFKQDTLQTYSDTTIKHPLSYTLEFVFKDSTGTEQKRKGVVIFAPNGKSVLSSHITND
jgi:hypothetical protein